MTTTLDCPICDEPITIAFHGERGWMIVLDGVEGCEHAEEEAQLILEDDPDFYGRLLDDEHEALEEAFWESKMTELWG